jgi:ABC-type dipeptide/oligopeptide/nickel transport system permease subunit
VPHGEAAGAAVLPELVLMVVVVLVLRSTVVVLVLVLVVLRMPSTGSA